MRRAKISRSLSNQTERRTMRLVIGSMSPKAPPSLSLLLFTVMMMLRHGFTTRRGGGILVATAFSPQHLTAPSSSSARSSRQVVGSLSSLLCIQQQLQRQQPPVLPFTQQCLFSTPTTTMHMSPRSRDESSDGRNAPLSSSSSFTRGQKIQVEVVSFGPLGASVDVVGLGHDYDDVLPQGQEPLGKGLILQREIRYFRQARNNLDVVQGEVLPAYVERVREETGRVDVSLRAFGNAKADDLTQQILDALYDTKTGELPVGDKSPPHDIAALFPGTSKLTFKKAVSKLYRQGKVQPGPLSIRLIIADDEDSSGK